MRVGLDQQRGYGRDELGRRERLTQSQTVGDTFRGPIGRTVTADMLIPGEAAHQNEMMSPVVTE